MISKTAAAGGSPVIRVSAVVGARPNFMKMAALLEEARRRTTFEVRLIHTGQHYSPEMSDTFFTELQMPAPDVNLGIGGGSHTVQTSAMMVKLEEDFLAHRPDVVLVVGDVNSTMAATLVAAKLGIRVAHVEAGLRSFDRAMPEEINRLVTDCLSDYLFASEYSGVENLLAEGVQRDKIFFAGNVMIDTLLRFREAAARTSVVERLGLQSGDYAVATLHRPSNVDQSDRLTGLVETLVRLADKLPVVFAVHPRTKARLEAANGPTHPNLLLTPPLGYLEFLRLTSEARLVLTDSGGIQEETTILNVPCLTLRENTERPITVQQGTNRLVGSDPGQIWRAATEVLDGPRPTAATPEFWDGKASGRILDVLENVMTAA